MENKRLYGLLCCLQRTLTRKYNVNFVELGVSAVQLQTMIFIARRTHCGKSVCQRDVENEMNLRASSVSSMLANLEKNGYITRGFSDWDARTKILTLTKKGDEVCMQNRLLMDKCDEDLQNALSEEEQETFRELILKVFESLENNGLQENNKKEK